MKKNAEVTTNVIKKPGNPVLFDMGGHRFLYEMVPLEKLEVPSYAGLLINRRRTKLDTFHEDLYQPIHVNLRGDKYFVVDGLRRMEMMKENGFKSVLCRVYPGLTYEQEAKMYAEQCDRQLRLHSFEKYLLLVEAKDPVALRLKAICEMKGLRPYDGTNQVARGMTEAPPVLYSIGQCMRILAKGSDFDLINILDAIEKAGWKNKRNAYSQNIVMALYAVFRTYGCAIPIALTVAIREMEKFSPDQFIRYCENEIENMSSERKIRYGKIASVSRYLMTKINEELKEE